MKLLLIPLLACFCLAAGPISVDSSIDDVLDALDARGKDLKTLAADVKMSDADPTTGDVAHTRLGKLRYELLGNGDARWHAVFDKEIDGRKIIDKKYEVSYADGKLIERDYRVKRQTTHQIEKPGQKMQLFNLDGPFPLPLGQDKAEVHEHFDVKKIPLVSDDPVSTVHLQLTPMPHSDLSRKFTTIDLWVDPKVNMPVRITVTDNNQNVKQTDLSNPQPNEKIKDSEFQLEKIDESGWDVRDEAATR